MIIKNILISVVVLAIVLGLIFVLNSGIPTGEQNPVNNTIPSVTGNLPAVTLESVYWSFTGESTSDQNVCLNKSRLSTYEFTMTGVSNINLSNFDGCYINLNGQKANTELRSITNDIKVSAHALTHFENVAQLCCDYRNKSYCAQATNLTVCHLNLTDIELPSVGKRCKIFSDCTGFCDNILNGFTPNNCGNPYSFCGSSDFCSCACLNASYKL